MTRYVSFVRDINSCLVALSLQITSAALHENDHQVTITLNYALAINKVSLGDEAHRQAAGVVARAVRVTLIYFKFRSKQGIVLFRGC